MAAITRWSTGSAVCSAVLRSPLLPSEPLLALRSANQLPALNLNSKEIGSLDTSDRELQGEGSVSEWDTMSLRYLRPSRCLSVEVK